MLCIVMIPDIITAAISSVQPTPGRSLVDDRHKTTLAIGLASSINGLAPTRSIGPTIKRSPGRPADALVE